MFKEFLGKKELEFGKYIEISENLVFSGVKGIGLSTLVRAFLEHYETKNFISVSIFPTDLFLDDNKTLEDLVISKLPVEKPSENNLLQILNSELFRDKKLIVALNKIHLFENPSKIINYFDNLRKMSFYKIILVITCDLQYYNNFPVLGGLHKFIFTGFSEKYKELLDSFCTYFNIEKLNEAHISKIKNLTSFHTALTKEILVDYKLNSKFPDNLTETFNNDHDLVNRTSLVFNSLKNSGVDVSDFGTESALKKYASFGLAMDGKYGEIFLHFFKNNFVDEGCIFSLLSKGELAIYLEIKKNGDFPLSITALIEQLEKGGKEFEVTDWTIYKHINNINKKIEHCGVKIENVRSRGYKLVSI